MTAVSARGPVPEASATTADGTRARLLNRSGLATASDGVRIAWEEFGAGDPTLLLLPSAPADVVKQTEALRRAPVRK